MLNLTTLRAVAATLGLSVLAACATATPSADPKAVATMMTGVWSSGLQAAVDPAYDAVTTAIVPIASIDAAEGAVWLYSQSRIDTAPAPYRQTVVRISAGPNGSVTVDQFRLVGQKAEMAAAVATGATPPSLTLTDVTALEGCSISYVADGAGGWRGAMVERACRNRYKNADWLDARTELSTTRLMTWDRGFKDDGTYVWGPQKGGYVFTRVR